MKKEIYEKEVLKMQELENVVIPKHEFLHPERLNLWRHHGEYYWFWRNKY